MYKNVYAQYLPILLLVLLTLACGSVQVGVVTPTSDEVVSPMVATQEPTQEAVSIVDETQPTAAPVEDFSHRWVEYWNPVHDYGIALPSHWEVSTEELGGFMITKSYDLEFAQANTIKGGWVGGLPPEGVVKLDFVPFEEVVPEQTLDVAISNILGADPEMTVVLDVEKITIGDLDAVRTTTARPDNLEDTTSNIAIRLKPEVILFVAAYPNNAYDFSDVQLILNSLVLDKSTPIVKPTTAPNPPLTVKNPDLSGQPTASYPSAWYGHITSLPAGEPYDDKLVLQPPGTGELGIRGSTPELEAKIQSIRDASGDAEYVHLWGVLYCNVDDYNSCLFGVDRLEYGDEYTVAVEPIDKWVGKIKRTTYDQESVYVFELASEFPMWYGISSPDDQAIQDQIEALADSDTVVSVWGDLLVGVQDINGTRIEVSQIDPQTPGGLPSSAACESGYLGSIDDAFEFVQYNLEIGNHWPFSYFIGDPFVIGYWQSEGVSFPRDQAYQQLIDYYLPSPENVVNITDKSAYPSEYDLYGMSVEDMFGPQVDVAGTIYSKGWEPEGQGEAILIIARCQDGDHEAYFWYGMLYAGDGFERVE